VKLNSTEQGPSSEVNSCCYYCYYYYCYYYLLRWSFHSVAAVLTLVQPKQIRINIH